MADQARPRFSYIPGLDGIRGIWVVVGPLLYHAATDTVSGGILGIDQVVAVVIDSIEPIEIFKIGVVRMNMVEHIVHHHTNTSRMSRRNEFIQSITAAETLFHIPG